jgi:hypothetical protein
MSNSEVNHEYYSIIILSHENTIKLLREKIERLEKDLDEVFNSGT